MTRTASARPLIARRGGPAGRPAAYRCRQSGVRARERAPAGDQPHNLPGRYASAPCQGCDVMAARKRRSEHRACCDQREQTPSGVREAQREGEPRARGAALRLSLGAIRRVVNLFFSSLLVPPCRPQAMSKRVSARRMAAQAADRTESRAAGDIGHPNSQPPSLRVGARFRLRRFSRAHNCAYKPCLHQVNRRERRPVSRAFQCSPEQAGGPELVEGAKRVELREIVAPGPICRPTCARRTWR